MRIRRGVVAAGSLLTAAATLLIPATSHAAPFANCAVTGPFPATGGFTIKANGNAAQIGVFDFHVTGANVPGFPITPEVTATTNAFSSTIFVSTAGAVYTQVRGTLTFTGTGPDYTCFAQVGALNVLGTLIGTP